jgi:ectoine hydroxylase-related dioxygenase (phytanoyl-CoA dioxygenase family)
METKTPSSDIASFYQDNGFYVAKNLFSEEECLELKAEAKKVMDENANPDSTVYVGASVASKTFLQLTSHPKIVSILEHIMPEGIMFLSDKVVFKNAKKRFPTPWHIDAFYWRETRPKLSVWISLDEIKAENGALKVLPGSHLQEWEVIRADKSVNHGDFFNVIPNDQMDSSREQICEIPVGSAIFFSDKLPHASCPNDSAGDRYSIIQTYQAPGKDEPFDLNFEARHVIQAAKS